jgi:probable HAF family extracellular repeat protein
MRDLGTLGGKFSYGYGVNRYDEVVGISRFENERDPAQHAFLYSGGTMHSLFDLLDSSREGWGTLINASDINDDGDIVGLGAYQGHQRAYRARRVSN